MFAFEEGKNLLVFNGELCWTFKIVSVVNIFVVPIVLKSRVCG